jgi:hypothetical protein
MSKPILKGARIMAGVCERVAAGVPQHVNVDQKRKSGALTDALYQAINGIRVEWPAALGSEHGAAVRELPA